MTVTVKVLLEPVNLTTDATDTSYVSTGLTTVIDKCTLTNHSATPISVNIYLVRSGSAASTTANAIILSKTLQVNETYTCPEIIGAALAADDSLQADASAISSVCIRASGRVIT